MGLGWLFQTHSCLLRVTATSTSSCPKTISFSNELWRDLHWSEFSLIATSNAKQLSLRTYLHTFCYFYPVSSSELFPKLHQLHCFSFAPGWSIHRWANNTDPPLPTITWCLTAFKLQKIETQTGSGTKFPPQHFSSAPEYQLVFR